MLACTLLFGVKGIEVAAAFARRDVNEITGQASRVRVSDTTYLCTSAHRRYLCGVGTCLLPTA